MTSKKDFKDTAQASAFLSTIEPEQPPIGEPEEPADNAALIEQMKQMQAEIEALKKATAKPEPEEERKTKRVNMLLKPSVYEKVKATAKQKKISINELMERLILAEYDKVSQEQKKQEETK